MKQKTKSIGAKVGCARSHRYQPDSKRELEEILQRQEVQAKGFTIPQDSSYSKTVEQAREDAQDGQAVGA